MLSMARRVFVQLQWAWCYAFGISRTSTNALSLGLSQQDGRLNEQSDRNANDGAI